MIYAFITCSRLAAQVKRGLQLSLRIGKEILQRCTRLQGVLSFRHEKVSVAARYATNLAKISVFGTGLHARLELLRLGALLFERSHRRRGSHSIGLWVHTGLSHARYGQTR